MVTIHRTPSLVFVFAMAFTLAVMAGFALAEASSLASGGAQALSCAEEPQGLVEEAPTALMQLQTQVNRGSSQQNWKPIHDLTPVGRTFLSMDPAASAKFLVEYYNAKLVELPGCEGAQRVAVRMPPNIHSDSGPSPLIVFIKDGTLPAGDVDIEAIIGGMNLTLERASLGVETYWFPLDNHDGWISDSMAGITARQIVDAVPVGGYTHDHGERGLGGIAATAQIPHTLQSAQAFLFSTPEGMIPVFQDDCRGTLEDEDTATSWWKSTFTAANPTVAADFAVNVLGATRVSCPYLLDAPSNCTSAAWVELPGLDFQLHFVRSSNYQHYPGEMDAFTQRVRSLRNISSGVFDLFMYNSLMLKVSSLDPWIERTRALGLPSLVMRAAEAEYALFLDIPENDIIIQLRSDHVSAGIAVLPQMCTQDFKV